MRSVVARTFAVPVASRGGCQSTKRRVVRPSASTQERLTVRNIIVMISATSGRQNYVTLFTNGSAQAESDTTSDKGGQGIGFRPHELLEAALANCMNMTLRMAAEKYGIPLAGVSVVVSLNRQHPETKRFEYRVEFPGSLSDAEKRKLLSAVERCPVRRTLSSPLEFALCE